MNDSSPDPGIRLPAVQTQWSDQWSLDPGTVYLNHGSFGPSPMPVRESTSQWSRRLESQPMDFFLRQLEPALDDAYIRLGKSLGASPDRLVFVDNATFAMNIVATGIPLEPNDEILLTDHEYGAVHRIWTARCQAAGARVTTVSLPWPFESSEEVAQSVLSAVTSRTRLIVISHVTSPTALTLPVAEICREARRRGIATCIDGPHAIAILPLSLDRLDADFYCASCHKWLCAAFGSGFLYVAPRQRANISPPVRSWGRSLGGRSRHWRDEYTWSGTRDPAAWLSIPTAIEFLEEIGLDQFRKHGRELVRYAGQQLADRGLAQPIVDLESDWFTTMLACEIDAPQIPMPQKNDTDLIQSRLWEDYRIEIPCTRHLGKRLLRISCHLYNSREQIDYLCSCLEHVLRTND